MKTLHLVLLFFVLANLLTPHTCDDELESDGDEAGVMVENRVGEKRITNSSSSTAACVAKDNCSGDDFCYCYTSKNKKTCYRDQSQCLTKSAKHKHHNKSSSSEGKNHHHHHPPPPSTMTMTDSDTQGAVPPPPPPKGRHRHGKTKSSNSSTSSTSLPPSAPCSDRDQLECTTAKSGKAPPPGDEPSPPDFSLPPVGAPQGDSELR